MAQTEMENCLTVDRQRHPGGPRRERQHGRWRHRRARGPGHGRHHPGVRPGRRPAARSTASPRAPRPCPCGRTPRSWARRPVRPPSRSRRTRDLAIAGHRARSRAPVATTLTSDHPAPDPGHPGQPPGRRRRAAIIDQATLCAGVDRRRAVCAGAPASLAASRRLTLDRSISAPRVAATATRGASVSRQQRQVRRARHDLGAGPAPAVRLRARARRTRSARRRCIRAASRWTRASWA